MRGRCLRWVKLRRTQPEQMSSGLPLKADIAQYSRHFAFVPISVMSHELQARSPDGLRVTSGNLMIPTCLAGHIVCGTDSFTASYTITTRFSRNRGIPAVAEL
jgi:hypothetical protein